MHVARNSCVVWHDVQIPSCNYQVVSCMRDTCTRAYMYIYVARLAKKTSYYDTYYTYDMLPERDHQWICRRQLHASSLVHKLERERLTRTRNLHVPKCLLAYLDDR